MSFETEAPKLWLQYSENNDSEDDSYTLTKDEAVSILTKEGRIWYEYSPDLDYEIFVDKGHTFGWGSVKQPGYYPHAVTWTLSTEQNGVKLISGKYTCFYSYSGD